MTTTTPVTTPATNSSASTAQAVGQPDRSRLPAILTSSYSF